MQNKEAIRTLWKEAGILFAITLAAGIILGYVYELTKEPIRQQQEKAIQEACRQVFQEAEEFRTSNDALPVSLAEELADGGVTIGTVYEAYGASADGQGLLGYVVETTSSEGYAGDITLYVGITLDGTVNGVSILEISETPGLGMRAEEVLAPQFAGKKVSAFVLRRQAASRKMRLMPSAELLLLRMR